MTSKGILYIVTSGPDSYRRAMEGIRMAEYQSGETVAVAHGGTGLSSIGSAGQVLKVNAAGVMPIIFAQAIMFVPITLVGFSNNENLKTEGID